MYSAIIKKFVFTSIGDNNLGYWVKDLVMLAIYPGSKKVKNP